MQAAVSILSMLILSIFLPYYAVNPALPPKPKESVIHLTIVPSEHEVQQVRLAHDGVVTELPLEEYLVGVVIAEMPPSFELEALKAQAIAARTFTLRRMAHSKHANADLCSDSTCCQAWYSQEVIEKALGNSWAAYKEKVQRAVRETKGEILTYEGTLIDAVYFSCSGGATESAVAVWGQDVPYLQSVESRGEEGSSKFQSQVRYTTEEVQSLLTSQVPDINLCASPKSWFGAVEYSDGGGVLRMEICDQSFRGTDLRRIFHLNSSKFKVLPSDNEIIFDVYGAGHRVGMSQYGANAMAKEGKSCHEILQYYYAGAKIEIKNP